MRIGIIGAGFTGLTAAYELTKQGHQVTIFEKDSQPGGLAVGYTKPVWEWTLEAFYHHWFTNDNAVLTLAKELHYPVSIKRPKTSVFVKNNIYQLDSPTHVLRFPLLSIAQRLRMGFALALLKYNPLWKPLEKYHATTFLEKTMGEKPYRMIWEPQLKNKFGSYKNDISLAWLWARIVKRTPSLAYPQKGFLAFAQTIAKKIESMGGTIIYNCDVTQLTSTTKPAITYAKKIEEFDKVIVTLPSFVFTKLAPQLPDNYKKKLLDLTGLGAITVIMRLKESFFTDNTYWLSVCETTAPVLAIVEHTNFMDKKHYHNEHLVYLGNYLPSTHPYFSMTNTELVKTFDPFLQKIHPGYEKSLIAVDVFKVPFAQPIIPINYSRKIPSFETPLANIYLANMQQVYPWDRGTNYAVELGKKIAQIISNNSHD